jgi:glycosyltransferase involved in cell wall biosynthesis
VLKLLLVAPACDGEDIGEAWVAFQWVRRLAARHEVTLVTYYKRGHAPVSRQLEGLRTIEWPEPPGLSRAERFNSMLMPGYLPFYYRARRWIRTALAAGERFDVAHQPVPVALRYPSPLAGLGIPFVLGPVGGSLSSPPGFQAEEGTTPWYVRLRALDELRLRRDPLLRRTYAEAACVLGIAPYVKEFLAGTPVRRFEVMSETGISELPEPVVRGARPGDVRLLFVGRIVRTKGTRDAIRALALVRDLPVFLDIVGEGFDRAACESLAAELGVGSRVRFHGWLPRAEVDDLYRRADVFFFPSYREPGGNVPFEAMGHGLPLIVSDLGGPGNVVDETCGFRVHPVSPGQYARDLSVALRSLASDPGLRSKLGDGARRRAAEIGLWDNKVEQMESLFAEILGEAGPEALRR